MVFRQALETGFLIFEFEDHTLYSRPFRPNAFGLHCKLMITALNTINYLINEKFNRSFYVKDC
jgi:hypothetical protein